MILISEEVIDQVNYRFYNGIDFDQAISHPKDGSEGMIYYFIDNWENEIKKINRDKKINMVIDNITFDPLVEINNDYIIVYQTGSYLNQIYEAVKKNLKSTLIYDPWQPIAGIIKK